MSKRGDCLFVALQFSDAVSVVIVETGFNSNSSRVFSFLFSWQSLQQQRRAEKHAEVSPLKISLHADNWHVI